MALDSDFVCSLLNVPVWKEYTPLPPRNQGMTALTASFWLSGLAFPSAALPAILPAPTTFDY
jgi:hypothetical protein